MMALAPLHRAAGCARWCCRRTRPCRGAGLDGTRELVEQIEKLHDQVEELGHPDHRLVSGGDVFGKTIAFNVVAKIDEFEPTAPPARRSR